MRNFTRFLTCIASLALLTAVAPACGESDPGENETKVPTGDDDDDDGGGGEVELIDDMEDEDGSITEGSGRAGAWYTYNDETEGGSMTPGMGDDFVMEKLAEAREGSTVAAHTVGTGYVDWGAGFGFDLNAPEDNKTTYDASAFQGVSLWARRGPDGPSSVIVTFNDDQTSPEGGLCDEAADECHDHYGATIKLEEEWAQFNLLFADAAQEGWGMQFDEFHYNALYSVQFQIAAGADFDIWIDDIGFIK